MTPIDRMLDDVQWVEVRRANDAPADSNIPHATHEGAVEIMGFTVKCYRLNTGQCVLDADSVQQLFGIMRE